MKPRIASSEGVRCGALEGARLGGLLPGARRGLGFVLMTRKKIVHICAVVKGRRAEACIFWNLIIGVTVGALETEPGGCLVRRNEPARSGIASLPDPCRKERP